jgi:RNA polymerase sigma factor (sigma-70 family)
MSTEKISWKIDEHLEALLQPQSQTWEAAWGVCIGEMREIAKLAIFSTKMPLDDEQVERLAREALSAMWDQIAIKNKKFQNGLQFRAYLVGIARNLARGINKPLRKSEVSLELLGGHEVESDVADPSHEMQNLESAVEEVFVGAYLKEAISRLRSPCKELIEKCYFQKVEPKLIAEEMKFSHKSLSSRIRQCIHSLAQTFYELGGRNPRRG